MAGDLRRLAAIVAADVVGYSRLMGRDESGTVARLREHRKQRLQPVLARRGGRLVKLTGDGALVEFPSAVDALGAAIEFQQAMADTNKDEPEDNRIVFRIGLHLGDLIVDGDDLMLGLSDYPLMTMRPPHSLRGGHFSSAAKPRRMRAYAPLLFGAEDRAMWTF